MLFPVFNLIYLTAIAVATFGWLWVLVECFVKAIT
jgi:hypothetical protein